MGPVHFVQDNESCSTRGVMRGLHFQRPPFAQAKLVRCVRGAVLDVAVDIRRSSPTFGQHVAVELTEDNHRQFFIPRGFAHGFAVLSDVAVFQYKCDNYYAPQADGGISILDTSLGIDWRIDPSQAILSEKDTNHPLLKDNFSNSILNSGATQEANSQAIMGWAKVPPNFPCLETIPIAFVRLIQSLGVNVNEAAFFFSSSSM